MKICRIYDVQVTSDKIIVDGRDCLGSIDYNRNLIRISDWVGESAAKVTLMHEVVHGILFERGTDFKEHNEEYVVDEIARGFMEVTRANPDLVQCICEDSMITEKQKGA